MSHASTRHRVSVQRNASARTRWFTHQQHERDHQKEQDTQQMNDLVERQQPRLTLDHSENDGVSSCGSPSIVLPFGYQQAAGAAYEPFADRIEQSDVLAQDVRVHLCVTGDHRGYEGNADASSDVPKQVENGGRIA